MGKKRNHKEKDMTYRTFNQWNKLGYSVKKGEKSEVRSEAGVALFNDKQVQRNPEDTEPYAFDYMWK